MRDTYKLKGWVQKPKERRQRYFAWCQTIVMQLGSWAGDEGPSDTAVVLGIVSALMTDDTFTDHIAKQGGDFLTDEANWEKLWRVGAGAIYHEYLVAQEKETWPEEGAA